MAKNNKKEKNDKYCSDCSGDFNKMEVNWINNQWSPIPHYFMVCDKCALEYDPKLVTPYDKRKSKKPIIDTTGWKEGSKTSSGKTRYFFTNKEDKEVELLPETGIKNGFKPVKVKSKAKAKPKKKKK